jgi:holo-[acyl-carrier protein] synthase
MILGLGVDVFDVSRMERALREGDPGLTEHLFTPGEIDYCRRRPRSAEHYAACFAGKEAAFKAFALDEGSGASWRDVEIRFDGRGACTIVLHGRISQLAARLGVARILASISHTHRVAAAAAVLES